jgi:nucleotide-binding universal stress UspA family protein
MKRILHPTDLSSASRPAFKQAVEMAKTNGAALEILHVKASPTPVYGGVYMSAVTHAELVASAAAWVRKETDKLLKTARAAGVKATSAIVDGSPYDRIVRAARARRPDVIVMGTHGRTGFSRLLLGSVASRVISTSPCPVLTVRGE